MEKENSKTPSETLVAKKSPAGLKSPLKEAVVIEKIFETVGLSRAGIGKRVGIVPSALSCPIDPRRNASHISRIKITQLAEVLGVVAVRLREFDPEIDDVWEVCEETSLKESWVAEKLGISRQALHDSKKRGALNEVQAEEVRDVLHSAGDKLARMVRRISP